MIPRASEEGMSEDEIRRRLKVLEMYEASVIFSMPDEGDYTDRELLRIAHAKSNLRRALEQARKE